MKTERITSIIVIQRWSIVRDVQLYDKLIFCWIKAT